MPIDYPENINIQDVNDEIWFDIINRTITPKNGQMSEDILVQNDANSRNLGFMIQRYFEGEDLSKKRIRVHYVNSLNQHDIAPTHSIKVVGDGEDVVSFQWLVSDKVCAEGGNVQFAIEFYNDGEDYRLFTKPTTIGIVKGICTVGEFIEPESDWFKEYSARMNILETYIDSFNKAVENGEFDGAYALNTFANAVKGNKSDEVVRIDDVSPVEHTMNVGVYSKNLLNLTSVLGTTIELNGGTLSFGNDGSVTGNGTPSGYVGFVSEKIKLPIDTYVLSLIGDSTNIICEIAIRDSNDTVLAQFSVYEPQQSVMLELKNYPTYDNLLFEIKRRHNTVTMSGTAYFQLEKGTTATEYTPYVDPTTATITRCGKNLIPYPYANTTRTQNGITFTDNGDGSITVNGTATADANFNLQIGFDYGDLMTAILNENATNGVYTISKRLYYNSANKILSLAVSKGATVSNERVYPQIELGTVATAWEKPMAHNFYTPNADGSVSGVTSLSPTTTLFTDTDNVVVNCEYNKDTNKALSAMKTADGTVVSQNADFAEVAEWADGNPDNEDRTGYFVCANTPLEGIVMKKATSTDDVKGVTIKNPAFAGNYSKDKLDSNGNLLPKYSYVAIIGFVPVIDNGTCTVGGRCMPDDNGCAIPSSNSMGYQVVNRIDENRVLIIIEPNGDMVQRIKAKTNKIQNEMANAIKGSKSGNIVQINDISPIEHNVKVVANKGKNLVDINSAMLNKAISHGSAIGSEFNIDKATNNVQGCVVFSKILVKPNTNYTISLDNTNFWFNRMFELDNNNLITKHHTMYATNNDYPKMTIKTQDNTYFLVIQLKKKDESLVTLEDLQVINLQLEESAIATEYEPYIDLSKVNVVACGKNIIPFGTEHYAVGKSTTLNGVTFTVNDDGSVTANGTATVGASFPVKALKIANQYSTGIQTVTLSGCPEGGSKTTYCMRLKNDASGYGNNDEYGAGKTIQNVDINGCSINCVVFGGTTVENITFYPMLEFGETASEYETPNVSTYILNEDNACDVKSISPFMQIFTDAGYTTLECEYNRDTKEELQAVYNNATDYANNMFANAIKGSNSGGSIQIDDVSSVEHNVRVKTSGKNLLNPNATLENIGAYLGVKLSKNKLHYNLSITLKEGKTVPSGVYFGFVYFPYSNNQATASWHIANGDFKYNTMNTLQASVAFEDIKTMAVAVFPATQENWNAIFNAFDVQLEYGTIATNYEPYINPTKVKITGCGKNLFDYNSLNFVGTNYKKEDNKYVFDNTSETGGGYFNSTDIDALHLKPNTTYTSRAIVTQDIVVEGGYTAGSMSLSMLLQTTKQFDQNEENPKFYIVNGYSNKNTPTTSGEAEGTFELITTFTTPADLSPYAYLVARVMGGAIVTFSDIQIEEGTSVSDYEPFKGGTYVPNADGVCDVKSVSPFMQIFTDNDRVKIECEYNKDIEKHISQALSGVNGIKYITEEVDAHELDYGMYIIDYNNGGKVLFDDSRFSSFLDDNFVYEGTIFVLPVFEYSDCKNFIVHTIDVDTIVPETFYIMYDKSNGYDFDTLNFYATQNYVDEQIAQNTTDAKIYNISLKELPSGILETSINNTTMKNYPAIEMEFAFISAMLSVNTGQITPILDLPFQYKASVSGAEMDTHIVNVNEITNIGIVSPLMGDGVYMVDYISQVLMARGDIQDYQVTIQSLSPINGGLDSNQKFLPLHIKWYFVFANASIRDNLYTTINTIFQSITDLALKYEHRDIPVVKSKCLLENLSTLNI